MYRPNSPASLTMDFMDNSFVYKEWMDEGCATQLSLIWKIMRKIQKIEGTENGWKVVVDSKWHRWIRPYNCVSTYIAVYNSLMCNWKGGGLHFDKHCIIMYAYLQLIFHAKNNEHLESGLVSAITYLPQKKINLPRY